MGSPTKNAWWRRVLSNHSLSVTIIHYHSLSFTIIHDCISLNALSLRSSCCDIAQLLASSRDWRFGIAGDMKRCPFQMPYHHALTHACLIYLGNKFTKGVGNQLPRGCGRLRIDDWWWLWLLERLRSIHCELMGSTDWRHTTKATSFPTPFVVYKRHPSLVPRMRRTSGNDKPFWRLNSFLVCFVKNGSVANSTSLLFVWMPINLIGIRFISSNISVYQCIHKSWYRPIAPKWSSLIMLTPD